MGFLVYEYIYVETRPSTVLYIMLVIDIMMHFRCLEIICRLSFCELKYFFRIYEGMLTIILHIQ